MHRAASMDPEGYGCARVIDWSLADPALAPSIGGRRIAAVGHSLGGYAVFGMIGGWPAWTDGRIKPALLLSLYAQQFLAQERLSAVSVPSCIKARNSISASRPSFAATPVPLPRRRQGLCRTPRRS